MPKRWSQLTIRRRIIWNVRGPYCEYCGRRTTKPETYFEVQHPLMATVDHRIPVCRGGTSDWDNLALACRDCNEFKGDMTVAEFEAAVAWATFMAIDPPMRRPGKHMPRLRYLPEMGPYFDSR